MAHSSTCLDASRKWLSTGIYSINKASKSLWLENQEAPQNGQNVHGFQVRTPICHIVPVSRAQPPQMPSLSSAIQSEEAPAKPWTRPRPPPPFTPVPPERKEIIKKIQFIHQVVSEPSRELQESLGPSGPEIPKKSGKSLPGPPALGSRKVSKKSEKSGKSLENVCSGLFRDFSGRRGQRPQETFSRLFGDFGPGGPERLL